MGSIMITDVVKQQVLAKLQSGLDLIAAHYGKRLPMPKVLYTVTGSTAGFARYDAWMINLNAAIMERNFDDFMERTVLHELAHLVTDRLYPEIRPKDKPGEWKAATKVIVTFNAGKMTSKTKTPRPKIQHHGARWKEVMGVLGVEASRCHSYDTEGISKRKSKYEYKCNNCSAQFLFGPKQHSSFATDPLVCLACNNLKKTNPSIDSGITFIRPLGLVSYAKAADIVKGKAEPGPESKYKLSMKAPTGNSKLAKCWNTYCSYVGRWTRDDLISVFINEHDCTRAGAATYYATCKKLYDAGV
jgi:SprT protein